MSESIEMERQNLNRNEEIEYDNDKKEEEEEEEENGDEEGDIVELEQISHNGISEYKFFKDWIGIILSFLFTLLL